MITYYLLNKQEKKQQNKQQKRENRIDAKVKKHVIPFVISNYMTKTKVINARWTYLESILNKGYDDDDNSLNIDKICTDNNNGIKRTVSVISSNRCFHKIAPRMRINERMKQETRIKNKEERQNKVNENIQRGQIINAFHFPSPTSSIDSASTTSYSSFSYSLF